MFFAARETVKAWTEKRERKRREEGRREERKRILREIAKLGAPLTQEQGRILAGDTSNEE